jgi:probable F420-dependent oxidoreductase
VAVVLIGGFTSTVATWGRQVGPLGEHVRVIALDNRGSAQPVERLARYLDELDAAPVPVPADRRFVGAQSPRMITLARDRTAGAFPYMNTCERTAEIRALLGPDRWLILELPLVLETDPARARDAGRRYIARYTGRRNYSNAIERQGSGPEELAAGGTDLLVDAFVAWATSRASPVGSNSMSTPVPTTSRSRCSTKP